MGASFASQPQSFGFRRVLFQVHLWTGIAIGLYVVMLSLTGSLLVYRTDLDKALRPMIIMVHPNGPRLTSAQLTRAVHAAYPGLRNARVELRGARVPGAAEEVWLIVGRRRLERLFDPYTGRDLGDTVADEPAFLSHIADLHDNLLGDDFGERVNGLGAVLLTVMCLTGAVIWWPGTASWRRSLRVHRGVSGQRFIWELHSMLGFWLLLAVLMWTLTALYFAFPEPADALIRHYQIDGVDTPASRAVKSAIVTITSLHFGRVYGPIPQALWALLGLVPAALFITGGIMWWNRVVRRSLGRRAPARRNAPNAPSPDSINPAVAGRGTADTPLSP